MPDTLAPADTANETILLERDGAVARMRLNRPDKLNAFNMAMWERLGDCMAEVAADPALRALLVNGGESKAFGAGADIAEFEALRFSAGQAEAYAARMEPGLHGLEHCPIPTVAGIWGACVGGGLELALLCDIRICGESAKLGIPINRIGHCLPYAGMRALVRLAGPATASEILLEGRVLSAAEALTKGLVTRVVPDAAVAEEAEACVQRIAKGAPLAARDHKRFIRRALDPTPLSEAERREPFASCDTEDYKEGIRAFLEKRKPVFRGA